MEIQGGKEGLKLKHVTLKMETPGVYAESPKRSCFVLFMPLKVHAVQEAFLDEIFP